MVPNEAILGNFGQLILTSLWPFARCPGISQVNPLPWDALFGGAGDDAAPDGAAYADTPGKRLLAERALAVWGSQAFWRAAGSLGQFGVVHGWRRCRARTGLGVRSSARRDRDETPWPAISETSNVNAIREVDIWCLHPPVTGA